MSQTHHYDYQSARSCFLSHAESATLTTHLHPLEGPDGSLTMDIARFGPADAPRALVLSSGTHGVEGYCGSFIQCELLKQGLASRLPDDLQLVIVHGVNPFGFAWQRRVNEDNIDLNRNYIDHSHHPVNEGYSELASILEPSIWNEEQAKQLWLDIFKLADQHNDDPGWQGAAITGGQYHHPNGVFYGGQEPAWSNLKIRELSQELKGKKVTWLDIHTALGPYGDAECIVEYQRDSIPLARAQAYWGERVRNTKTNESISSDIAGSISVGTHAALGDDLVMVGLEYGTVKGKQVLQAIIGDQWLHRYGDLSSEQGRQLKQEMMDAFYPDDPKWRESVLEIALEIIAPILESGA